MMDVQGIAIIVIFALLIILEQVEQFKNPTKEGFRPDYPSFPYASGQYSILSTGGFPPTQFGPYQKPPLVPPDKTKLSTYTNNTPLLEPGYHPLPTSINFGRKDNDYSQDFRNFGTFGSYPPNPLCPSCFLTDGKVNPPYLHANDLGDESGEQHGRVATRCSTLNGKNYADLSKPFLVAARANGRPRQCRRLI